MSKNLMDLLKDGVVLGDSGLYLEANWRGYDVPEIIGSHPEALRQIHQDFYNAGSQVLQALIGLPRARSWLRCGAGPLHIWAMSEALGIEVKSKKAIPQMSS